MNNPILSICIPTYNREKFLTECLQSIIGQFSNPKIFASTEIVISDNGSSDNTTEVVKGFQARSPNIIYARNAENLGVDRNILNVINMAKGEYCWFLGDDDALFEDALEYVLPILESGRFDYILANAWGYDKDLKEKALSRPNLHFAKDAEYARLADFVKSLPNSFELGSYFTGFSCQMVRRQVWQNVPDKEQYIGSHIIHARVILSRFKNLPALVLAKPVLKVRADSIRWETFPGLESVSKRYLATRDGQKWILDLYEIPYSKLKLNFLCYSGIASAACVGFARKYIFTNQKTRNLIKRALGK